MRCAVNVSGWSHHCHCSDSTFPAPGTANAHTHAHTGILCVFLHETSQLVKERPDNSLHWHLPSTHLAVPGTVRRSGPAPHGPSKPATTYLSGMADLGSKLATVLLPRLQVCHLQRCMGGHVKQPAVPQTLAHTDSRTRTRTRTDAKTRTRTHAHNTETRKRKRATSVYLENKWNKITFREIKGRCAPLLTQHSPCPAALPTVPCSKSHPRPRGRSSGGTNLA